MFDECAVMCLFQDALFFLMMFFSELSTGEDSSAPGVESPPPVMKVGEQIALDTEEKISPEELHVKFDEMRAREDQAEQEVAREAEKCEAPVFIK